MSGPLAIRPVGLSGRIAAPPGKSVAHRAVIAAALARGGSIVRNLELSQDIRATVGAMMALGASIHCSATPDGRQQAFVEGIVNGADMPLIDCRESGSTLRFLIPVALAVSGGATFTGAGRLSKRPLGPYLELFSRRGIRAEFTGGGFPLKISGRLNPGTFTVPGGVSSQFITGLMFALPLLGSDSVIQIEGNLESMGYIDVTMDTLKSFGIAIVEEERGKRYAAGGGQRYISRAYDVEGDWSQAAFLLLMGLLAGPVFVAGLDRRSRQGDRAIEEIFRSMGGDLQWKEDTLVAKPSKLKGVAADVSQCPDLAPAIAAAMAVAEGESRIVGGRRLRLKESDRIASIAGCLNALGACVAPLEDGMQIKGVQSLAGGKASSEGDHRIAMMAAAVSPVCKGPVLLLGWEAVGKSWPGFWQEFRKLGGACDGQPVG